MIYRHQIILNNKDNSPGHTREEMIADDNNRTGHTHEGMMHSSCGTKPKNW